MIFLALYLEKYISAPMPGRFRNLTGSKPRGVAGRNAGVSWVLNNTNQGVLYFADDDNSYDIRLFNEVTNHHPSN